MGQDLLTLSIEGLQTPLYPWVATQLADALNVSAADLPRGRELSEVARRHLAKPQQAQDIYRELRNVFRDLEPIATPEPLSQLAKMSCFRLYVTTTFDLMTERAIDEERFEGQRQTLVFSYAPNDKQDLPREFNRLNRPAVFHLMGRLSGTPGSYAITREDILEFINSLDVKTEDSPHFLFDKLRFSNLLIIGSHLTDWLVRFFIRNIKGGRHIETLAETSDARASLSEIQPAPVLFLRHFRGGTKILRHGGGAADFVDELYRRWTEIQPEEEPETAPTIAESMSSRAMQAGAVFLSHARADQSAAESIRDALDRAGVDVIIVEDDSPVEDKSEKKLRRIISECSLFVPVISEHSMTPRRRFFQKEWVDTILEARRNVNSGRFILPVAIDDTSPRAAVMPKVFGELEWERLPSGEPSPEFVETVVQLQRNYRSGSSA